MQKTTCRIVFFGDSICNGQGVSLHRGWVPRLSAAAEALSSEIGCDVMVVNASVNGSTTRQALERMAYEVQSHDLDILLVQFGLNDCNFWITDRGLPRVSPESFEANLIEIITRGRHFGARAILLNTNHPTTKTLDPQPFFPISYAESSRRYNQIIRRVAKRFGDYVHLNDIEKVWSERCANSDKSLKELLLQDGLHPSPAGHDLYYEVLWEKIAHVTRRLCLEKAA
jgi:acyl-CoA thioesterase I